MSKRERIKRPKVGRTRPIRAWSTLFGAPGDGRSKAPSDSANPPPGGNMGNLVSRSVELGYRVIDEYIRQGQKTARRFGDRSYGPAGMSRDMQELTSRMGQYAADATSLWFEFLQLSGNPSPWPMSPREPDGGPPRPARSHSESAPSPVRSPAEPRRVRVAVASSHPTEVLLDVRPDGARRLAVHSLRAAEPEKPRLTDVTVEDPGAEEPVTIRIRVPADQPAGVYSAAILDEETNCTLGSVRLWIMPE